MMAAVMMAAHTMGISQNVRAFNLESTLARLAVMNALHITK